MLAPSSPKRYEGAGRWLLKIITGLFVVVFLGIHFIVNHLIAPEGLLTYSDVVKYYQNPIIVIMEISFLIVVVVHSFLGLRAILLDLNPSRIYFAHFGVTNEAHRIFDSSPAVGGEHDSARLWRDARADRRAHARAERASHRQPSPISLCTARRQ